MAQQTKHTQLASGHAREDQVMQMNLSALDDGTAPTGKSLSVPPGGPPMTLEAVLDIPITLIFEVGRTEITVRQLLELKRNSFIDLRQVSVDSIDIRVNDVVIAHGEAIALQQRYGVRMREVEKLPANEAKHEAA